MQRLPRIYSKWAYIPQKRELQPETLLDYNEIAKLAFLCRLHISRKEA